MFSQNDSEKLGRDKKIILTKIRQYKSLFPDTFKTFKTFLIHLKHLKQYKII